MLPRMLQLNGSPNGLLQYLHVPRECVGRLLSQLFRKQKGNIQVYVSWEMEVHGFAL